MIIHTILLHPSGAVWTDEAANMRRPDPSGAIQVDAEHPTRNPKVVGTNPTSGSKNRSSMAIKQDEQMWLDQAVATEEPYSTSAIHLRTGSSGADLTQGASRD